ncbi:hypothetical protein [Streptomyces sp. NPDC056921]|uniref:hypothetical protein n=1 Tax=Streptomyces sp. NPDC056921 TaxID=3345966 RepID=UPI003644F5E5
MKSTKLERRTQKLQLTTGMPWAQALKHVAALAPSAVLIPEAHPSQAVLETFFLKSFAWPQADPHHPWGIRCVEPSRNRLVLVFEDQQLPADDYESLTRDLVRAVVPHVDEWGEVRGIPGARFTVARGGILIRRLNMPGSITIVGIPAADWGTAMNLQRQEAEAAGMRYCHDSSPDQWHADELPYREPSTDPLPGQHPRRTSDAWLGSGLLRRAPLLRTIGVPLSTTAWTNPSLDKGQTWIVDYIHEPQVPAPLPHQGYIGLLTDPECGLAITRSTLHCSCARFPEYSTECRFNARSSRGQLGALQVRFSRRTGDNLELYQEDRDDYAARRKLYRPIPAHLARGSAETIHAQDSSRRS